MITVSAPMHTPEPLEVMKPKPCRYPLLRLGGEYDGTYLVPDDLEGIAACFSPGVNNLKSFEDYLTQTYGIACHMCDFSSDEDRLLTPLIKGKQTFLKKWLDVNAPDSISLAEWVQMQVSDATADLMLQMDIEGAEYKNLLHADTDLLARFRIIVLELHGLAVLETDQSSSSDPSRLLAKLDQTHLCVHAHPNNCGGTAFIHQSTGMNVPDLIELTFLRRDRFLGDPSAWIKPMLPHPLDISVNCAGVPPLHLNRHWCEGQVTSHGSSLKCLQDQLEYANFQLRQKDTLQAAANYAMHSMQRLYHELLNYLPEGHHEPPESELMDLSRGRPYLLSSRFGDGSTTGMVEPCQPFFFHTDFGTNESITIDLGAPCQLWGVEVMNRTDVCQERAVFLQWIVHNELTYDKEQGLPLCISVTSTQARSMTPLLGRRGQFLTLYSPSYTAVHLSEISVRGVRTQ